MEYCYTASEDSIVYDVPAYTGFDNAVMKTGYIAEISAISGDFGLVSGETGDAGWVEMSKLTETGEEPEHSRGDINNDGKVDMYDLGLLSEHLGSREYLPDGIFLLRKCELAAADINGDGKVTDGDVLVYLMLICS